MFIIFEGPDGSGKSSLVEAVGRNLGGSVTEFHKGRPLELNRRWVLHEYAVDAQGLLSDDRHHILSDRWHWGEVTYAPIKRPSTNTDGYGLLGVAGWRWVEMFLMSRGAVQFVVNHSLDVLQKRLRERGDDFVSPDELDKINTLYKFGAKNTGAPSVMIMPPNGLDALDYFATEIISIARVRQQMAAGLVDFPEYIGPPRPEALLIGDRRSTPDETILPFMPVDGNSGEYLMTALPEDLWRRVGIINAGDIHDARLLELYDVLGTPRVVALGRLAEREVRSSGLYSHGYSVLPHPQYVRRFHHKDKAEYGRAIESFSVGDSDSNERYSHWILP